MTVVLNKKRRLALERQCNKLSNHSDLNFNFDDYTKQTWAAIVLDTVGVRLRSDHFSGGSTVGTSAFRDVLNALDIPHKNSTKKQELAGIVANAFLIHGYKKMLSTGSTVSGDLWKNVAIKLEKLGADEISVIQDDTLGNSEIVPDADLGRDGEEYIYEYEKKRLTDSGHKNLADEVKDVSKQNMGYDITSFETDGATRLIEVKTTRHDLNYPFFLTAGEIKSSTIHSDIYWLYRVFNFESNPKIKCFNGPLTNFVDTEPIQVRATMKDSSQWRTP